ncbi:MAG: prolyl oligopeptidase family serine peptidase [Pseudomonadota bacterium]
MSEKTVASFGSWPSQLSASKLAQSGARFGHLSAYQGYAYWTETNAQSAGRAFIMRASPDTPAEAVTDDSVNVRSRLHEMGGAEFLISSEGIFFVNDDDSRIYLLKWEKLTSEGLCIDKATVLTPEPESKEYWRFADFSFSKNHESLYAVRERHTDNGVLNELVKISLNDSNLQVIVSGFDFFAFPKISSDERKLLWLSWNMPQMPWDGTELWVGHIDVNTGLLSSQQKLAGGPKESIYQPSWCPDGSIAFVSDRDGWWNLYHAQGAKQKNITSKEHEFGLPQWILGTSTYGIAQSIIKNTEDKDEEKEAENQSKSLMTWVTRYQDESQQVLCVIDSDGQWVKPAIDTRWSYFGENLCVDGDWLFFYGASEIEPVQIVAYNWRTSKEVVLRHSISSLFDDMAISQPESLCCDSVNDRKVFAFYYPPLSLHFEGPDNQRPPLIVLTHGGPTAATHPVLNPSIQYWTSRGFAVVDVNYGGSTGYGRAYKDALNRQWGIVDVEDCVSVVDYLIAKRKADQDKVIIKGGSAGGYTTLCALTFTDKFAVGASRYGIADLKLLAQDTHKFEARYLDQLVGDPEADKDIYEARSPIYHTDKINCPMLLLQGLEDKVVPPSQAEVMVKALKERQIPYAYVTFGDEGHGFRNSANIQKALESELLFFTKMLNIDSPEKLPALEIHGKD